MYVKMEIIHQHPSLIANVTERDMSLLVTPLSLIPTKKKLRSCCYGDGERGKGGERGMVLNALCRGRAASMRYLFNCHVHSVLSDSGGGVCARGV